MNQKEYYIQYGKDFIGNSVMFWALGSCGYTGNIDRAQRYSLEDAIKRRREGVDKIWECDYIDSITSSHVDAQNLDSLNEIKIK